MQLFESDQFDHHERIVFVHDDDSGLDAIIAIHDTHLGPAIGGCRVWPYPDAAAALHDVLRLSRGMTYKAACADVPFGGGKCVVVLDPARGRHAGMMRALGRAIADLNGRYITGEDVGTDSLDMATIRETTTHVLGAPADLGGSGDPSPSTALGCLHGIRAAAAHRLGSGQLSGLMFALQGLGNVGWELARLLTEAGARLRVCDVREARVRQAQDQFDATPVRVDAICAAEVDVFVPCAMGAVIDDSTVPALRAAIVAGAANNQLAHARHAQAMADRGILYAPDYVINAGGMIQLALERAGSLGELDARVAGIAQTLRSIFHEALAEGITTAAAADRFAERRFRPQARPVR